jgi:hypothetical protein
MGMPDFRTGISDVQALEIITRDMIEKEVVVETDLIKMVDNFEYCVRCLQFEQ